MMGKSPAQRAADLGGSRVVTASTPGADADAPAYGAMHARAWLSVPSRKAAVLAPAGGRQRMPGYRGPGCTCLSGEPSSASASAFSSFLMSSGDSVGRSTLIVSLLSLAVSGKGGL
jgi:hypothetical protein